MAGGGLIVKEVINVEMADGTGMKLIIDSALNEIEATISHLMKISASRMYTEHAAQVIFKNVEKIRKELK